MLALRDTGNHKISLLTAHSNTIYTLAVNTTCSTPEEKACRHVTLVGATIVFSLNYRKFNCFYTISTHFNTMPKKQMFTEVNFIFFKR